jgi:hypothetical protein
MPDQEVRCGRGRPPHKRLRAPRVDVDVSVSPKLTHGAPPMERCGGVNPLADARGCNPVPRGRGW